MTRAAFENAMVIVMALGGSTNAVLHLIAMARAVDVELDIDDFQRVSDRIPFIADLKPSGKYVMEDVHKVGGIPAVMKYLLEAGLIDGDCLTVTGKTSPRTSPSCLVSRTARRSSIRSTSRSRPPGISASSRQPRAGRRGREDHRQGRRALFRTGAGVRRRGGHARGAGE
jgi:dihydroxyacid dehydratase/phosphogluconate dehydratase